MLKTPPMLAAELSGKTGVSISAPYANENSRIILSAADIAAENGKIKLQSYGDQSYYAGQGELYTLERRSYKTGKWYNRKHITEVKEHKNAKPDAVNLSASQGIDIKSGGSIDAYATVFDAPKGSINIEAGRKLTLYAVEELNYDKLDSHKKRKFLGITYDKVHDTSTQQMQTALPSRVVAESANLQSGWDTKLQGTQFETTLGGAVIRAGVGDQARADAKIILEGIKSSIHTETVSSSKSALWQKQAGRGSNIETLQLPSFTGPVAPVLSAPGGYIVDIPKGNLKTEIEKLAKQPEYAYLKQLQVAKNINWNQVQLAYDRWDYKQEGLTEAGAAIIALAVTVVTSGAGTGAVLGLNGAAAAATDAAFASLASQASVSFINNKGDVGKTLKELGRSSTVKNLVVAAATAGVADKIGASALNNVSDKQWINNLTVNLANAGSAALINTAINGGSLKDNLGDAALGAIVSTVHGEVASKIKFNLSEDYITHKIAHAIAGCAAAAANKGKCQDGAIGAAVGEIVGEALTNGKNPATLTAKEREQILAYSKLVAGTVSGVVGGDVNAAANAAEVAVKNNQLSDKEGREFDNEMTACAKQNNPQLCRKNTVKKYQNVADKRLAASIAICTDISRSTECRTIRKQHLIDSRSLHSSWEAGLIGKDDEWYKLFSKSYTQADLALQSYHLNTAAKSWLQSGNTKPLSEWMSDQGYTLISGVNPRFIPIPRGFVKQNTPITNVKYPEGISFDTNLKRHLANADGFSQKQGIKGAHNRTNFMAELNSRGGRVKSETQTDIEGITRIKYEIPTLDRTGKPDGGFKEISSIKTVYNPKKFSDDKILQMAQNAASQGYSKASKIAQNERTKSISERKNVIQFSETFDGIKFRSYFDVNTGRITNIHPE
ncbi:beta strand repeat-containing protein [Neisseria meningitidis]|uniref:beta strand repeat-containing protein n=5 Tax=Neisseria meningitidis TaxID=487 RepID=UPI0013053E9C|nr:S-layer family protein [Neisseria meningitidis]